MKTVPGEGEGLDKISLSHHSHRFPRKLAFSKSVPQLYRVIREFYPEIIRFLEGMNISNTQIDEFVCAPASVLFLFVSLGADDTVY